ncbi:MAG: matrixin family metalloprotease [Deltaproteobacteria bacterium]|nr:matrixin family metalloprotease [Deltaproteobacteria bacterium]
MRSTAPTAALITTAIALATTGASAYVFYLTEDGDPLRWKEDETIVRLSTVPAEELSQAEVEAAIDEALLAWSTTDCVPAVRREGTTDATEGSSPPTVRGPADNIVVFIESASHWSARRHGRLEIAVTLIANNSATGEIVDADIEGHDAGFVFSVAERPGVGQVDFRSTLVHEVGHLFGLDHSETRDATMFASYDAVDPTAKRSLHLDDIDGVCALYAIPFPPPDDDCCAGGGASGALGLAAAALVLGWRRRRETTRAGPA